MMIITHSFRLPSFKASLSFIITVDVVIVVVVIIIGGIVVVVLVVVVLVVVVLVVVIVVVVVVIVVVVIVTIAVVVVVVWTEAVVNHITYFMAHVQDDHCLVLHLASPLSVARLCFEKSFVKVTEYPM